MVERVRGLHSIITAVVVATPAIVKSVGDPHRGKEHEVAGREDHTVAGVTGMNTARLTVATRALV